MIEKHEPHKKHWVNSCTFKRVSSSSQKPFDLKFLKPRKKELKNYCEKNCVYRWIMKNEDNTPL